MGKRGVIGDRSKRFERLELLERFEPNPAEADSSK
jgi:hypothetical protein